MKENFGWALKSALLALASAEQKKKSHSLKLCNTEEQINRNHYTDLSEKICASQGDSDISCICNNL